MWAGYPSGPERPVRPRRHETDDDQDHDHAVGQGQQPRHVGDVALLLTAAEFPGLLVAGDDEVAAVERQERQEVEHADEDVQHDEEPDQVGQVLRGELRAVQDGTDDGDGPRVGCGLLGGGRCLGPVRGTGGRGHELEQVRWPEELADPGDAQPDRPTELRHGAADGDVRCLGLDDGGLTDTEERRGRRDLDRRTQIDAPLTRCGVQDDHTPDPGGRSGGDVVEPGNRPAVDGGHHVTLGHARCSDGAVGSGGAHRHSPAGLEQVEVLADRPDHLDPATQLDGDGQRLAVALHHHVT
jgi:hypothetical protein